jgi:hypothetical protein
VVFVVAMTVHPSDSSAVMFTAMEHLVSASDTAAVASKIGDAAFALASAFNSSVVA